MGKSALKLKASAKSLTVTFLILALGLVCLLGAARAVASLAMIATDELLLARGHHVNLEGSGAYWLFFFFALPITSVPLVAIFMRMTDRLAKKHEAAAKGAPLAAPKASHRRRKKTD
jgi:hypothetical protein